MPNNSKLPIFVIFTTVVLDSMGIGIIIPVMPALFAEVTGTEKISDIAIWGGLLASTFALMQFIFGPILGSLLGPFWEPSGPQDGPGRRQEEPKRTKRAS